jgi:cytochrome P450
MAILDDFDHHSLAFATGFRDVLRHARAGCPVIHSEHHGGYYVLTRFEDVQRAFRDHRTFASERLVDADGIEQDGGVGVPGNPFRTGFLEMDPPVSINLRRLVNPWLSPAAIEAGRDRLQEAVTWAFDQVIERGECDLVTDVANPFQCMAILDLLGIPLDRWKTYKELIDKTLALEEGALEGIQWILGDIYDEVVRQKAVGGPGLIADLCRAEVDGEPIEDDLTTELVLMLLLGGFDTTVATIAHSVRHLGTHPEDRQRLLDEPELLPTAIEELLRYYVPAPGMARTVKAPVVLSGQPLHRGDRVMCSIASANFDEAVFDRPDVVDLTRQPNPHLAFGTGTHRCIGADLARHNTELFLRELLARVPEYTVESVVTPVSIPLTNGLHHLVIRFEPGERRRIGDGAFPTFSAARIRPVD